MFECVPEAVSSINLAQASRAPIWCPFVELCPRHPHDAVGGQRSRQLDRIVPLGTHLGRLSTEIVLRVCRYGWELGEEALVAGVRVLDKERRKPNFGNAGAVNNLLSQVAERMEARTASLTSLQRSNALPEPIDFDPDLARGSTDAAGIFDNLVGCRYAGSIVPCPERHWLYRGAGCTEACLAAA